MEFDMDIRDGMKKLVRGVATGGSIAALLTLSVPANAGVADLESQRLDAGYSCTPECEGSCGGKDDGKKDDKKDKAKKDDKKDKKGKKEGKCGEGKCG